MANNKHSKHSNQVRIIGGQCRGRKLTFSSADGLRPTPDSVRERLFNWLGQDLIGLKVLDLFAGSGALGFEAASRNAAEVAMVEINRNTFQNLQKHIRQFGWQEKITLHQQSAAVFLQTTNRSFDVVFLDPPFNWTQWQDLFPLLRECLKENAFVYIEAGSLPEYPDWLEHYRDGRSGLSRFVLLRKVSV